MTLRRPRSIVKSLTKHHKKRQREHHRRFSRKLLTEQLEDRRLLAGPELLAIRPDEAALLQEGDTLSTVPREFNLLFKGGADLLESTVQDSVRIVRSGGDGTFGEANDVTVSLGFAGLNDPGDTDNRNLQSIVLRPASVAAHNPTDASAAFPDDVYRIEIDGLGTDRLTNRAATPEPFMVDGVAANFARSFRIARGSQVVAVVPQPVSRNAHSVTLNGTVTGGQFRLELNTKATQPIDTGSADVRLEIEQRLGELPDVQPGDIEVTGPLTGGPWLIELQGQFAGEEPTLALKDSALTGSNTGISVARTNELSQASNQIIVYFSDDELALDEVTDPKFYRLVDTNNSAAHNDDSFTLPDRVTYDPVDNTAALTFATIPDGTYRLDVGTSDESNDVEQTAIQLGSLFDSTGIEYVGYVGEVAGDKDLYEFFLEPDPEGDDLDVDVTITPHVSTLDVGVQLFFDNGTTIVPVAPTGTVNGGQGAFDSLAADTLASGRYLVEVTSNSGRGSYLLDIDSTVSVDSDDDNTTFGNATKLGSLGIAGATIAAQIEDQGIALPRLPGSEDEPGHRHIQEECHLSPADGAVCTSTSITPVFPNGAALRYYNFPEEMGSDPSGNPYPNLISETEKDLIRQIWEIYSSIGGITFVEAPGDSGLGIEVFKGDLLATGGDIASGIGGVAGLGSTSFLVIDQADYPTSQNQFGGGFFSTAFHELGHSLGLGHAYDLPSVMGSALPEPGGQNVWPTAHDVVHFQRLFSPDSTDIDLYEFKLDQPGRVTAEVYAERPFGARENSSLLDSALTLFDATGNVVARNDNYNSADALIAIDLAPGTYYVGVTSSGNLDYDPRISDSGFGGRTDGPYDLLLNLESDPNSTMRDLDSGPDVPGTLFDGDADGTPGGQFQFWFESSQNTIFVDKANDSVANAPDGNGRLSNPIDEIDFAMEQAASRIIVPTKINPSTGVADVLIQDGDTFLVVNSVNTAVTFEFDSNVSWDALNHTRVPFDPSESAAEVAMDIAMAINGAFANMATLDGSTLSSGVMLADTTVKVTDASLFPSATPFDIRINSEVLTVTAIAGNNLTVTRPAPAVHAIGDTVVGPRGVVGLAGISILDVSNSPSLINVPNIVRIVGNSGLDGDITTLGDNRPYLLGTNSANATLEDGDGMLVAQGVTTMVDAGSLFKLRNANFDAGTSSVGLDRAGSAIQLLGTPQNQVFLNSYNNDSVGGDTNGFSGTQTPGDFGGIVFRDDSDLEDNGIFLNWVNHANIQYGGGEVAVSTGDEVFSPVHMIVSRPTLSFNTISNAAAAAISANPDSFDDSAGRIGPDIYSNSLSGNSVNGLFVRVETGFTSPV